MSVNKKISLFTVSTFACILIFGILILNIVNDLTIEKIADNKLQATRKIFSDIIPGGFTTNAFNDSIEVIEPGYLGTRQAVTIFRIRNEGEALGVVIFPVIAKGYKSEIELGIGISKQGIISGVRVIDEDEDEGLGDQINQENSDWIYIFDDTSLANLPREQWRIKSEDGYFDQVSGATITSRSVINAVRSALEFHNIAGENLYSQ